MGTGYDVKKNENEDTDAGDGVRGVGRMLESARFMDSNECNTLIPAVRGAAGKPTAQVLAEIDDAGAAFGAAAREKFGKKGEW